MVDLAASRSCKLENARPVRLLALTRPINHFLTHLPQEKTLLLNYHFATLPSLPSARQHYKSLHRIVLRGHSAGGVTVHPVHIEILWHFLEKLNY